MVVCIIWGIKMHQTTLKRWEIDVFQKDSGGKDLVNKEEKCSNFLANLLI